MLDAQTIFGTAQALAQGANAGSLMAEEWAFRTTETGINNSRALDAARMALQKLRDANLNTFASNYYPQNGPGTNQGTNGSNYGFWYGVAAALDRWTGGTSDKILLSPEFGTALNAVDGFFAGMADGLTMGLSTRARSAMWGQTATQNHTGEYFEAGKVTGEVMGLVLGFGNPCSLGLGLKIGFKAIQGLQAAGGLFNAGENLVNGKPLAAAMDAFGVLGNVASFLKACFRACTMMLAKGEWGQGWRAIEEITVNDLVASRNEFDPTGPVEWKRVEELFRRTACILTINVDGREIGTYAYNITKVADILDHEKSDIDWKDEKHVTAMEIKRFECLLDKINGLTIFLLVEEPNTTFVSQSFVDRVEEHGLQGFHFVKLWPLREGVNWEEEDRKNLKKKPSVPSKRGAVPVNGNSLVLRLPLAKAKPSKAEKQSLAKLMDQIDALLYDPAAKASTAYFGNLEGDDVVEGELRLFLSCPDADKLVEKMLPWLKTLSWEGSVKVLKRYGEYVDVDCPEEYVDLS